MGPISSLRNSAKLTVTERRHRKVKFPSDNNGNQVSITEYFGQNVFNIFTAEGIPDKIKNELKEVSLSGKVLCKESQKIIANSVKDWAIAKGATHFTHWFQPLTGSTAEKHDSFLDIDHKNSRPIEKLGASELLQGEPDASSFPNGGSRSTFEARGYTSWDFTSPLFIMEATNTRTLFIPTAFVSYDGQALDVKTPLLRSVESLDNAATKFMKIIGDEKVESVRATCGCEQEYFLIDEAFYQLRPDLIMTGRTLLGASSQKNQQLSDHYFGSIHDRVLAFMGELDFELHKLGIPSKTRHNEVAPGQFEVAPVFEDANVAADHNQLMMKIIRKVANRHNFEALMHEKPFADVNGSGKHLNWSLATNTGINLLEPGKHPDENLRFLAVTATVITAVKRHAKLLRMAIASAGNDHRLGGHEAPPSIISVFVGETIEKIFDAILKDTEFSGTEENLLEVGANQLAHLFKDNTDRNRTSPFAFTGNRFEFRAVGSNKAVGFPLTFLNAAVTSVFNEGNELLEKWIDNGQGMSVDAALSKLTKLRLEESIDVVFNGDGYSQEWVEMAQKRGLPNLKTTAEALAVLKDDSEIRFIIDTGVLSKQEVETRHNVLVEQFNMLRSIEFTTLNSMINQFVLPAVFTYKSELAKLVKEQKEIGFNPTVEMEILKKLNFELEGLFSNSNQLKSMLESLGASEEENAKKISGEIFEKSEEVAHCANRIEGMLPDKVWDLPTYMDMLFLR